MVSEPNSLKLTAVKMTDAQRSYRFLLFIPNLVTQLVLDCALHVVAVRLKAVASINAALDSLILLSILLSF